MSAIEIALGPTVSADLDARRLVLRGRVQGVGFRPFVHRLATDLGLTGRVWNTSGRVTILAAGSDAALRELETRLILDAPALSRPELLLATPIAPGHWRAFEIAESRGESPDVSVPPDVALCGECRRELADPTDRRYRYPFINCTQCGPRFTIIDTLPYDRQRTSMAAFELCATCLAEYTDPSSRRFHAEPIACPACGPALTFEQSGSVIRNTDEALDRAAACLQEGLIVCVKGLGGYHLVCDATNQTAVARLRERKARPSKPLAVMIDTRGADGLEAVRAEVALSSTIATALLTCERPIALAPRRQDGSLADNIAPGLTEVGILLPYTAVHILLLEAVGSPLVVTSGNPSGEPLAITADQARSQLAGVADAWLDSDRPIRRRADDSVVREIAGRVRPLRIGRGYSPLELEVSATFPEPVLAVGGHQKNAIALGWNNRIVLSPHVGDLGSRGASLAFSDRITELKTLYGVSPTRVICDAHPDYASTRWAVASGLPVTRVHHHLAHASAAVGEGQLGQPHIAFTWDGVGLGDDGTSWGGEAFHGEPGSWTRVASTRPFRIPGAVRAGREPWRSRASLSWELGLDPQLDVGGIDIAKHAWTRDVGCRPTSAVGRLFDAAASWILGLETYGHEAQGPCELEALAERAERNAVDAPLLPIATDDRGLLVIDWEPLVAVLADDRASKALRAAALHRSLIAAAIAIVETVLEQRGPCPVAIGGGVFQNRVLTEGLLEGLSARGIDAVVPETIPLGDGGLAFGQLIEFLGEQT